MIENKTLTNKDFLGLKSTLCTGCGHDSISVHIKKALLNSQINPKNLVKVSGIGCSSKLPTYFSSDSHGFNTIHGRMAPIATGIALSRPDLKVIGLSGDGDTASIGLGGFAHLIRRDVPMVYIVANNGVYGLTKGQFSATADKKSTSKSGTENPLPPINLCLMALQLGCRFVSRMFSGDPKRLVPLLEAALAHNGTAFIDILSPCVAYANHSGSTKSYDHIQNNQSSFQDFNVINETDAHTWDSEEQKTYDLKLNNNRTIKISQSSNDDINDKNKAFLKLLEEDRCNIPTGLFYHNSGLPESKKMEQTHKSFLEKMKNSKISSNQKISHLNQLILNHL